MDNLNLPFEPLWLLSGLLLLVLLLLAVWGWKRSADYRRHRQIRRAVRRLGPKLHQDLLLPDGVDGLMVVDYVVLTHKGILLIAINWLDGHIFGGEQTDTWTQMDGRGSHRFTNPLHQLDLITANVRAMVPTVPVSGIVLFAGDCSFPKDKPAGIRLLADLPQELKRQQVPSRFETAWDLLFTKAGKLVASQG